MRISPAGLDAIKRHEGLRLTAYPDPASGGDPWTIGYGHTRDVERGQTITAAQAEQFLREDLAWVETCIERNVVAPLTQGQYDALCSLIFNIGQAAFTKSTLMRLLNQRDYAGAAQQFERWNIAAGQVNLGLTNRRAAERAMFLSDAPAAVPAPAGDPTIYSQEGGMPIPALAAPFLMGLANSLIGVFAPLAQEKITKEINRHTDKPQVGEQIATALIEGAKTLTGKPDPIAAVAAAREEPAIVAKLQADALADLDKLLPVLDKLTALEQGAWAAEEESRRNADDRARMSEVDQDPFLTKAIVGLVVGLMVTLVAMILGLMYLKADTGTIGTLVGLFAAAGGAIVGALTTRIQHRYGSSRGSAAKDVINAEIARRQM